MTSDRQTCHQCKNRFVNNSDNWALDELHLIFFIGYTVLHWVFDCRPQALKWRFVKFWKKSSPNTNAWSLQLKLFPSVYTYMRDCSIVFGPDLYSNNTKGVAASRDLSRMRENTSSSLKIACFLNSSYIFRNKLSVNIALHQPNELY